MTKNSRVPDSQSSYRPRRLDFRKDDQDLSVLNNKTLRLVALMPEGRPKRQDESGTLKNRNKIGNQLTTKHTKCVIKLTIFTLVAYSVRENRNLTVRSIYLLIFAAVLLPKSKEKSKFANFFQICASLHSATDSNTLENRKKQEILPKIVNK